MAQRIACLALICLLVLVSAPAQALTPEELEEARAYVRGKVQEGQNMARLLAEVVNLYASPDISSASYRLDNGVAFNTLKLPYYREFALPDREWSLFAGINLSYLKATSHAETPVSDQDRLAVNVTWRGYSGLTEAGARFPLGHGLTLSPSLGAGLAQLRNQTEYLNQFSKENFAPIYRGITNNFSLDAAQALAALSLAWRAQWAGLDLACNLRYAHTYMKTIRTSDAAQEFQVHLDNLSARASLSGPLGLNLGRYPLGWKAFVGNVTLLGPGDEDLGFSHYFEGGLGLSLDLSPAAWPLTGLSLGGSLITGDGISGYAINLGYDF
ncbi:MAG: hypothetical protein HY794_16820 [Desulfarculus sp.]|nr:hypothetical protein [Desulfarculus sp.]